jgi:hypothetical protein
MKSRMAAVAVAALLLATTAAPACAGPETWPGQIPAHRQFYCALDRGKAGMPDGYRGRVLAEFAARAAEGRTPAQSAKEIADNAGCADLPLKSKVDYYAVNWPANEPRDIAYLCSDHRGDAPPAYAARLAAAMYSRFALGMGPESAAQDVRALGGCPLSN